MNRAGAIVWMILLTASAPSVIAGCGGSSGGARGGVDSGPPAGFTVTASLDVGTRYQVMQGFGGSVAFYADWLTGHPHRDEIYQAIFADLGLQILRIGNWYGNSGGSAFDDSVAVVRAAQASLGTGPLVLLSSWSPPASLKSNLDTRNGYKTKDGATLASTGGGGYRYADFGAWWAASLGAYADAGVVADFISPQNEPDFQPTASNPWESCLFDATEGPTHAGYDKALAAVFEATAGLAVVPKIIGPEIAGISGSRIANYLAPLMSDPLAGDLAGVAHHLYSGGNPVFPASFNASMAAVAASATAANKPLFMTEFSSGTDMFNTAWLIHNAVTVEGVAAYLYWGLTWAPPAMSGPPSGLVTTENPSTSGQTQWTTARGYTINDAYYAVRHFSKWIGVGWQRVAVATTSSFVNASAFVGADDQQATLVLLNIDVNPHAVTIDAGSFGFGSSAVYRTSGTDERTNPIGPIDGPVMMPGRSLVTVTLGP